MSDAFHIEKPEFDAATGTARFGYRLGEFAFTETLGFPAGFDADAAGSAVFAKLLDLTAIVLGTSYFKLKAPLAIDCGPMPLTETERDFALDVYSNGLGEFYARNDLRRFGRLSVVAAPDKRPPLAAPVLRQRALLPTGGGKDSLVSAMLLEHAGVDFVPFAVNPRGPIGTSIEAVGKLPVYVTRTLDPEMIRLSTEPGYFTGHVPSTAINSMIGALAALLYSCDRIVLSNERSASEGNTSFDGREVNHQYSKSLAFEDLLADVLAAATSGALGCFSLLRPYSEARIATLFARETRFDRVFSSCNRNFRYDGHDGPLWCGECPKCHFVFLILAAAMEKDRLIGIFGRNLLAEPTNERSFRELTGLAGQKPWECVGEILEAAACLWRLAQSEDWRDDGIVTTLRPDLVAQYGEARLDAAFTELMTDSDEHRVPRDIADKVAAHAL